MKVNKVNGMVAAGSVRRFLLSLVLLWLAGVGLRLTILATPPIIPLLHADLHLSQTEIGILTGLPSLLFAFAAVPGSLLISRVGALHTLVIGLLLSAIASGLRGAIPNVAMLYAMTILMGLGVAIMQPALPPLVREWLPNRISFGTAVYTNGLLVGEILPVALTIPLVLPLVGDSWRWGLVVWSFPVALTAVLLAGLSPRAARTQHRRQISERRWWPNWRDALVWRLGLMLGTINSIYFATNGFLPDYLNHVGRPDLISDALTALNLGQLPASILLLAVAERIQRQYWPYVVCGILALIGIVGIIFAGSTWIIVSTALLGFSAAAVLVLMLALPPLLSHPHDVHRTTAGMVTISYSCAVIIPIISGVAWDLTKTPSVAFVPIAICAIALIVLPLTINFKEDNAQVFKSNGP